MNARIIEQITGGKNDETDIQPKSKWKDLGAKKRPRLTFSEIVLSLSEEKHQ